jgi:hypothetical protein
VVLEAALGGNDAVEGPPGFRSQFGLPSGFGVPVSDFRLRSPKFPGDNEKALSLSQEGLPSIGA